MSDLSLKIHDDVSDVSEARAGFTQAIMQWFHQYGDKIHAENHFLRFNPVKVFYGKEIRFERTADLVLKSEATSTPHAYEFGKVLQRRAVCYSASWTKE